MKITGEKIIISSSKILDKTPKTTKKTNGEMNTKKYVKSL